ncbi:MAG: hypothetical protein WC966_02730 [Bradymonadales bacterium]|jgi:hypothetical protein
MTNLFERSFKAALRLLGVQKIFFLAFSMVFALSFFGCEDSDDELAGPVLFSSGFGDYSNSLLKYDGRLLVLVSGTNQIKDALTKEVYIDLGVGAMPFEMMVLGENLLVSANGEHTLFMYKKRELMKSHDKGKNPSSLTYIDDHIYVTYSGDFTAEKHGSIAKFTRDLDLVIEVESQCNNPQSVVKKGGELHVISGGDLDFSEPPTKPKSDSCVEVYDDKLNAKSVFHYKADGLRGAFGNAVLIAETLYIGTGTMDGYFSFDGLLFNAIEHSKEQGMSKLYEHNGNLVVVYFNNSSISAKKTVALPEHSGPIDLFYDSDESVFYVLCTLNSSIYKVKPSELGL